MTGFQEGGRFFSKVCRSQRYKPGNVLPRSQSTMLQQVRIDWSQVLCQYVSVITRHKAKGFTTSLKLSWILQYVYFIIVHI